MELSFILDRARDVKKKDDDLHNAIVDLNFSKRKPMVLNEEVGLFQNKNIEATTLLRKKGERSLHIEETVGCCCN